MIEGTATAVIGTGTGIVMTGATGTEDTTGTVIDVTTRGGQEDTTEDGDIDENAKRDLVGGVRTKCKSMPLQRVTAATVTEDEARNAEGTVWAPLNEGVLLLQTPSRSL
jgi:hypothetical protein